MTEETLFIEALEISDALQRAEFLDRECASDASLRDRVGRLLEQHERAGGFLGQPAIARLLGSTNGAFAETIPSGSSDGPGTSVGPYKLLQKLGEGGMGHVWMAEQSHPVQRKVAVKLVKAGVDNQQLLARFEAERQALALMDHPNIARVFDAGATGEGRPYFVMELVKGIPITQFCDERRLTPRQRLELFVPVCQAVQHAHQKGIIHRDIKPSNVLVAPYDGKPVPKVIDFGIVKAAGQRLTDKTLFTEFGAVVGTPEYMSPEQAELNQLDVDTRSDIYSLGVLLYELLTGTTPVTHQRVKGTALLEVLRVIREEEPPKPSTRLNATTELPTIAANRGLEPKKLSGLVRGELDWIVMKCLEKDRARRYETANAFAADVQRYLNDEPVQACPPSAGYRMRKFARRNKRTLATAGTLALMLLVAVGAVVVSALRVAEEAKARLLAESKAKKDLEFNLYLRNIPLAQVEAKHLNWGGVEELLKECPQNLRGWEYHYLKRLPDAPLANAIAPVTGGISANLDLAFSPEGRLLAGPGPNNSVTLWDLATGKQRSLKGNSDNAGRVRVLCVAFRPSDGRLVISASSDGTLRFWDPETGRETRDELKAHDDEIVGMTFSPDGRRLATIGADEIVKVWDLPTLEKPRKFRTVHLDQARMLRRASFSPDGRLFAYGAGNAVMVFDLTTNRLTSLEGHKDLVYSVTFSPQGDRLLSASWDLTAKVWNLATGEESFTIRGHACAAWAVEFSPKGDLVAVAGSVADPAVKIYDVPTGKLVHSLVGHATRVGCVAFHPDGKRLVSCSVDQTIRIWELDQGKEVLTLRGHSDLITRVLFDPNGWWLASSSNDGKLQVWDGTPLGATTGRPCVSLVGHTRQVFGLNFSPDGQQLVSASHDKTVRVWDVAKAREIQTLRGHDDTVFAAVFGRDGLLISGSYDETTRVWDARTGEERQTLKSPETRARGLALSRDGKMLVTSSITPPFQLWRWDMHPCANGPEMERRSPRLAGHNGPAFGVAFSPDDTLIAIAGTDGVVSLWDAATGLRKVSMAAQSQVEDRSWAVAFHPTDRGRLAAGYSDNRVMIWDFGDAANGDTIKVPTKTLKEHTHDVYCVAYSPDGRWLASGSWHEVIIWDTATNKEVHRIGGFRGLIWSVAWSPDRLLLAVGGGHEDVGTIELWDLTDLPTKAAAIRSSK